MKFVIAPLATALLVLIFAPALAIAGEGNVKMSVDKQFYEYAQQIPVEVKIDGIDKAKEYSLIVLDTYNRVWQVIKVNDGPGVKKLTLQVPRMKGLSLVLQRADDKAKDGVLQVASCYVFFNVRGANLNRPDNFVNMIYGGGNEGRAAFEAMRQWGLNGGMAYEWETGENLAANDMDFYHEYLANDKRAFQETDFMQRDRWFQNYPEWAVQGLRLCTVREDVLGHGDWKAQMIARLDAKHEGAPKEEAYKQNEALMRQFAAALRASNEPWTIKPPAGFDWAKFLGGPSDICSFIPIYCFHRSFNWYDADQRQIPAATMQSNAHRAFFTQPLGYSIGDEISNTNFTNPMDYDYSPTSLKLFREWLKTQYASLEGLNQEWGTAYANWDAVVPYTSDETRIINMPAYMQGMLTMCKTHKEFTLFWPDRTPADKRNYASWSDFRSWQEIAWADALTDLAQMVRKHDANTPIGILGAQAPLPYGGFNYELLTQSGINWIEAYDICCSKEMLRSFNKYLPPEKRWCISRTQFPGGVGGRYSLWFYVLMRDSSNVVWQLFNPGEGGYLDEKTLKPTEKAVTMRKPMLEVCDGIGKAFMESVEPSYPIGIYLSQRSAQAHWMIDSEIDGSTWVKRYGSYEGDNNVINTDHMSWTKLLNDLGYQYDFVGQAPLLAGDLQKRGYKALILPKTVCVSDAEAAALRKFVEDGGLLIADSETGVLDGHARAHAGFKGAVDDLFGIKRSSFDLTEGYDDHLSEPCIRCVGVGGQLAFVDANHPLAAGYVADPTLYVTETGVQGEAAKALVSQNGHGGFFLRDLGKGKTLYMASSVLHYNQARLNAGNVAGVRAVIGNVLKELAKLQPYGAAQRDAQPVQNLVYRPYQFGPDCWLYGIALAARVNQDTAGNVSIAGLESIDPISLKFNIAAQGHIYDARAGRYLGQGHSFTAELNPTEALPITVLPYKVDGVDFTATPVEMSDGGVRVDLVATIKSAAKVTGRHIVRFQTINPAQMRVYYDTALVPVTDGVAKATLYLSPNDASGTWKFSAVDVHTGMASAAVAVEKKASTFRDLMVLDDPVKGKVHVAAVPEVEIQHKAGVFMAVRNPFLQATKDTVTVSIAVTLTPESDIAPDGLVTVYEKAQPEKKQSLKISEVLASKGQTATFRFEHPLASAAETEFVIETSYEGVTLKETRSLKMGHMPFGTPKLIGDVSDPLWQKASVLSGFASTDGQNPAPERFATSIRVAMDSENLYVAIEGKSPNAGNIKPLVAGKETEWYDHKVPTVEVLVGRTHAGQPEYVFGISADGGKTVKAPGVDAKYCGVPWQTATKTSDKGWTAEAKIPLAALACGAPANGERWLLNFTSYGWDAKQETITQYCPQGTADFNLGVFAPIFMVGNPNASVGKKEQSHELPRLELPLDAKVGANGMPDAADWDKAGAVSLNLSNGSALPMADPTSVKLLADSQNLYFRYACDEHVMGSLVAKSKAANDPDMWEDDVVGMVVRGTPEAVPLKLLVNSAGLCTATAGKDAPWDAHPTISVSKNDKQWIVEGKLSWAELKVPPKSGGVFGLNLLRTKPSKPGGYWEDSSWSPLFDASDIDPQRFGTVTLK